MSPAQDIFLRNCRRHIADWEQSIRMLEQGEFRLRHGQEDVSDQHVAMLRSLIVTHHRLLAEHDPDGMTAIA